MCKSRSLERRLGGTEKKNAGKGMVDRDWLGRERERERKGDEKDQNSMREQPVQSALSVIIQAENRKGVRKLGSLGNIFRKGRVLYLSFPKPY